MLNRVFAYLPNLVAAGADPAGRLVRRPDRPADRDRAAGRGRGRPSRRASRARRECWAARRSRGCSGWSSTSSSWCRSLISALNALPDRGGHPAGHEHAEHVPGRDPEHLRRGRGAGHLLCRRSAGVRPGREPAGRARLRHAPGSAGHDERACATVGRRTPSEIVGSLVLVAIMLFATVEALRLLGFVVLADLLAEFIQLGGQILLGLIIFAIGLYLANLAERPHPLQRHGERGPAGAGGAGGDPGAGRRDGAAPDGDRQRDRQPGFRPAARRDRGRGGDRLRLWRAGDCCPTTPALGAGAEAEARRATERPRPSSPPPRPSTGHSRSVDRKDLSVDPDRLDRPIFARRRYPRASMICAPSIISTAMLQT